MIVIWFNFINQVRVQRNLNFQPALRASCGQDVLAQRSFLLARKFSMFYSAHVNYFFKENFLKTFTSPSGKWRINSTCPTIKSTSPRLSDLNFFVPCKYLFLPSFIIIVQKLPFKNFCHIFEIKLQNNSVVCTKIKKLFFYFCVFDFQYTKVLMVLVFILQILFV